MYFRLPNKIIDKLRRWLPVLSLTTLIVFLVGLYFSILNSPPDYLQGDSVRITGKKRDELQKVIQIVKDQNYDMPLQFINFRD